jgi:competence protein ComEA
MKRSFIMSYPNLHLSRVLPAIGLVFALSTPFPAMAEGAHVAPVDINTASAETLADALNGIGLARAQDIVEYRKSHGPFEKPADLARVKGVGPTTVEKNLERIQVK